jgi:hypothetical protein
MTYLKILLTAGAIAAGLAGFTGAADAKVKFYLGVEPQYDDGYYGDGYSGEGDDYRRPQRFYDDRRPSRLSCRQVRRSLRARGWRNIEAQDCDGRYYSFIAYRHGDAYELRVRSRDGEIVSRDPL